MIRGVLYVGGGSVFRQAVTFAAQMVLARNLGEGAFGDLTLAFSIFLLMAGLGDAGMRLYAWREVALAEPEDRPAEASRLFLARFRIAVPLTVLANVAVAVFAEGQLAVLLHLYSLGVLVNQAAFDWVFLAQERFRDNFLFSVTSGCLYLLGVLALVGHPTDVVVVPVIFALSFAVPGLALVRPRLGRLNEASLPQLARMAWGNRSLVGYDLLQRSYGVVVIISASWYYGGEEIAKFRVPHLVYAFVCAFGVYAASSVFSRVARETAVGSASRGIARGTMLVLALCIPGGVVGAEIIEVPMIGYLGSGYADSLLVLGPLVAFVALGALANFAREVTVSSGAKGLATASYAATIAVVVGAIVAHHPPELSYLAYVLIGGEVVGLAVVVVRSPRDYVSTDVLLTALASFVVGLLMRTIWRASPGWSGAVWVGASSLAVVSAIYAAWIVMFVRRTGLWHETR